jgi:D-glycero-D-manno-heptose 1,7-bisphosphate phosphatase
MRSPILKKAVFFDRDGTIIKEQGYVSNVDDVIIIDGVLEGMRLLKENGFLLIMVSNQSGVARGYFSIETVYKVNARINELLKANGTMFDGMYFCPHYPNGIVPEYSFDCECRKPRIKMALDAASDFNISLNKSYKIGDKSSDVEFGRGFGAAGVVHIATGYSKTELRNAKPDFYAKNLVEAANWIIQYY